MFFSEKGIQPVAESVKDLQNRKSPKNERDVMEVVACVGFDSCYIKNLHFER